LLLFKLGKPLMYFDLDVVITGNLAPLTEWDGFGIIQDWNAIGYMRGDDRVETPMYNSSVMKLVGDEGHVWDQFKPQMMQRFKRGGDQRWITARMPDARTFPAEWFPSYKVGNHADAPPDGALAVIFHGEPKPASFESGWVKDAWV
jgi:hypothetical protein